MTTTTTTNSLYAFVNAYEAYDGHDIDAFLSEWAEKLGTCARQHFPTNLDLTACPACGMEGTVQSVCMTTHVWSDGRVEDGVLSFEGGFDFMDDSIDPHIACYECGAEWAEPAKVDYR